MIADRLHRSRASLALVLLLSACGGRPRGSEFRIDDRFQIELIASEPLLDGPVAIEFDDRGQMLVFEAPTFPPDSARGLQVKRLEDADHDGRPERAFPLPAPMPLPALDRGKDGEGHLFTTTGASHIQFEGRSISDHGESALIYPITVNPVYPVLTEADHSTSTCGIAFCSNPAIPGFQRALLTAEPVHNLLHCDLLSGSAGSFVGRRASEQAEFLASTDPLFRPVSVKVGPNREIYVVDYYAPVAGPTEVLDVGVKPAVPLFRSIGKGRIYRITPRLRTEGRSLAPVLPASQNPGPDTQQSTLMTSGAEAADLPTDAQTLEGIISDPTQPDSKQTAAVKKLGSVPGTAPALFLLSRWRSMTTAPRREAIEVLLEDTARLGMLLDALEKEQIPIWCLDDSHRVRLLSDGDPGIAGRVRKLLEAHDPNRNPVIKNFGAALSRKGDRAAGELVYKRLCGRCHTIRGGNNYGPDLWTVSSRPPRRTLIDILLPNERMAPGREMYLIDLKGGGNVDGVIGSQTETCIYVLHDESRQETIFRGDVRRILLSDSSAMPVDLASQMNVQDMADLLQFLTTR